MFFLTELTPHEKYDLFILLGRSKTHGQQKGMKEHRNKHTKIEERTKVVIRQIPSEFNLSTSVLMEAVLN